MFLPQKRWHLRGGKKVTAAASSSKRKKSVAQEKSASKGIVIRELITATSQSREQAAPKDVSGKKTARKTRAKRKRSVALPSSTLLESPSSNTRSKKYATTSKGKLSFILSFAHCSYLFFFS